MRIQDAIDAVPKRNKDRIFIFIKPGIFREKIVLSADKPFVTLAGTDVDSTVISWNDAGKTMESATVTILALDFVGRNITIQVDAEERKQCAAGVLSTFGRGSQSPALRVSGDRPAFYGCRMLSYQNTLLDDSGRHYYKDFYIEGATDFVCGDALSLFEGCQLHSISDHGGAVTAQSRRSAVDRMGYIFVGCSITGRGALCWGAMEKLLYTPSPPGGWDDWGKPSSHRTVFYGEYECFGPGARLAGRVAWPRPLSAVEVAPFQTEREGEFLFRKELEEREEQRKRKRERERGSEETRECKSSLTKIDEYKLFI
ncbi:unnamed protein product [Spirodela intermedia]|uniref:pectinesterase n=1 Tax=Spirodela intermedia TaxID=51605 RepID=A0A7I8KVZ6_SPIIN|nr:unnamed protein product [Spirodela intermedia]